VDIELQEGDGSSTESLSVGEVQRSQQPYESMREQSTVGGASTGKTGGRVYTSNPTDPTQYIEPHRPPWTSYSNSEGQEVGGHAASKAIYATATNKAESATQPSTRSSTKLD